MRRLGQFVLMGCACLALADAAAQDDAIGPVDTGDAGESIEPAVTGRMLDEAGERSPPAPSERGATDTLDLGRTEVTGNQELPKVLYIVPWQKSDPGNLLGRPVNSLLDEVLAPLDREEFIREVDYYSDLGSDTGSGPGDE